MQFRTTLPLMSRPRLLPAAFLVMVITGISCSLYSFAATDDSAAIGYASIQSGTLTKEIITYGAEKLNGGQDDEQPDEPADSQEMVQYAENPALPKICISTQSGKGNTLTKAEGYVKAALKLSYENAETEQANHDVANGSDNENAENNSSASDTQTIDTESATLVTASNFGSSVPAAVSGEGRIKVRGNSTAAAPKKPYTFKFDEKTDLAGFGAAKKWVLLANCYDPTLMRNALALDLAATLGLPYTPQHTNAEVWMDGKYLGLYTLTEGISVGESRIAIDTDSGDFLLEAEKDRIEEDVTYVTTGDGLRFAFSEPEEPTEEQFTEVEEILEQVSAVLDSESWPEVQKVIDVPSFAAFYLLNEYLGNVDFFVSSTYFFYQDGRLYAGPVWDFDISSGNANPAYAENYALCTETEGIHAACGYFAKLLNYPQFRLLVKNLLLQKQAVFTDLYSEGGWIDRFIEANGAAIARNASEAGWLPGTAYIETARTPDETYEENVSFLRDWLAARHQYLLEAF